MAYSFTEKKRIRKSFAKRDTVLPVPFLLATQLESYAAFLQEHVAAESRKNEGLQNQSVLYIQKGLDGPPEVLIDPNAWGETVALSTFVPSKDAKYAVYGVSRSGTDWQELKVIELATKKVLPDTVEWVKVSGESAPCWKL